MPRSFYLMSTGRNRRLQTAELIRVASARARFQYFSHSKTTPACETLVAVSLGAVDYIVKPVDLRHFTFEGRGCLSTSSERTADRTTGRPTREQNLELESANLNRLRMMINLGQELAAERDPAKVLERVCSSTREILGAEEAASVYLTQR